MAFCNKLGSLVKQSVSQSGYMSNSIRCMSSNKLFVGGLSFGIDDQSLKDAFSSFGDVSSAKVILDRETQKSKGFGFVEFESSEIASSALSAMDGQELNGRSIRVSFATERSNGPRIFNNNYQGQGGGGGGGYSNERY